MQKIFISADELLIDSYKLAANIYQQGFKPDFIIGVWRGGAPVGIAVQEYFDFMGEKTNHIAIRTSSYYGIEQQHTSVQIHGMNYVIDSVKAHNQLLIIDDVVDTGRSIKAIKQQLRERCGENLPTVKFASPWYKPNKNVTDMRPDFYLHETDNWLVFPHELSGLSLEEIREGKPDIAKIIDDSLLFKEKAL